MSIDKCDKLTKLYETERKRVVMCDYDVNNIGFYLPDGSYEAMFDPEQDFARLIREHICEAAEISFRKLFKKYMRKDDDVTVWVHNSCWRAYSSIHEIKLSICCEEQDINSIEDELTQIEEEIDIIEASIDDISTEPFRSSESPD